MADPKPFSDREELPASYGVTRLALIARDPYWIHAYWDIAPDSIQEARRRLGNRFDGAHRVLRMYDVTSIDFNGANANNSFDLGVGHAESWYINLWCDNVSYCGEIGLRAQDGTFVPLARSNTVTTPRAGSSDRRDLTWMEVQGEPGSRTALKIKAAKAAPAKKRRPGERISPTGKRIELTEADIREHYARIFPLLRLRKGMRRKTKAVEKPAFSQALPSRALPLRVRRQLAAGIAPTLEDLLPPLPATARRLLRTGSSEEMILSGASEQLAGGASERAGAKGRKFFFEIGTELIVYGRTEPDAQVFLEGKNVPLRPDGTFTMRFALPDGKIPLGFAAHSADKVEIRKITTSVERTRTIHIP